MLSNGRLSTQNRQSLEKIAGLQATAAEIDKSIAGKEGSNSAIMALSMASHRRVDFVMIGDSNQRKDGSGFFGGYLTALSNKFGQYATGIGNRQTDGSTITRYETQDLFGASAGSPAGLESIYPSDSPQPYSYVASGTLQPVSSGITIKSNSPIDIKAALRFHHCYGTFDSGTGSFRCGIRIGVSPYTTLASGTLTSTNTGAFSKSFNSFDLSANETRSTNIEFKIYNAGTSSSTINGPMISYYTRVENPSRKSGISCHTLYGVGSMSAYDMASKLNTWTDSALTNFFYETRRLQISEGQKPITVVYINTGLNDQNETGTSIGWRAKTNSTKEGYIDNIETIISRIKAIYTLNGWEANELYFLLHPSHPIANPDDSDLIGYRNVSKMSSWQNNSSLIDLTEFTSHDEILANGWYLSGGVDKNHLNTAGYDELARRVVDTIPEF